jgi:hypothetical protein
MKDIDIKALNKCCDRVYKDSPEFGLSWLTKKYIYDTLRLTLIFANDSLVRNGSKGIDFAELAETDKGTFYHDVWGCDRHVSRDYPCELVGGFSPRIRK